MVLAGDQVHLLDMEEEAIVVEAEAVPIATTETVIATGIETEIATEIEGTTTATIGMITTGEMTEENGANVLALPALVRVPRPIRKTKTGHLLKGLLV